MKNVYAIIILFFSLIANALHAETYYVSPSGNNKKSGRSKDQAWQSIDKINTMSFLAGDSILFEGGQTFNGAIELTSDDKGTSANPIVIASYGKEKALITTTGSSAIFIYNTQGIEIRRIDIKGPGRLSSQKSRGIFIFTDLEDTRLAHIIVNEVEVSEFSNLGIFIYSYSKTGGFDDITIKNSVVHDIGDAGITSYADFDRLAHRNIYISNCKVFNISGIATKTNSHSGSGIMLGQVDGAVIEYCEAYNNGWLNAWKNGGPVGIWGYMCNNLVIQYNESHHNKTGTSYDGGGFDLDGGSTNSIMQYNYSHDNDGAGYLLCQYSGAPAMKNLIVRYNISENDGRKNGYAGIHLASSGSSGGIQNTEIYNNSIYISAAASGAPKAFYSQSAGIYNTTVRNNIFYTTKGVEAVNVKAASGIKFENNSYWTEGGNLVIKWASATYNDLENWRKGTSQEVVNGTATGMVANPEFEEPGAGITLNNPLKLTTLNAYKLKATSPLIGKGLDLKTLFGTNVGNQDFWGNSIPQLNKFNIGAHQGAGAVSEPAPAPAPAGCTASGFLRLEKWSDVSGGSISSIPLAQAPSSVQQLTLLEASSGEGNYGQRMRGYICPPLTGAYTFLVAGDDQAELWLSTSEDPALKKRIAYTRWRTAARDWDNHSTQQSVKVTLQAGKRYYIEVLHKQEWGSGHIAAAWKLPNGTIEAPIAGSRLSPFGSEQSVASALEPVPAPAPAGCAASGFLRLEKWSDVSGGSISSIPLAQAPSSVQQLTLLEASSGEGNYGQRMRGYICPPLTGAYTFLVAGDDQAELWLSTSEDPALKKRIAYTQWRTAARDWDNHSTQQSVKVTLQAGKRYYIEVLHKQEWGGGHVAVAWNLPNGTLEAPIAGSRLSPFAGEVVWATADQSTSKGVAEIKNELTVYPNPITDRATVQFKLNQGTQATIEVIDISGRIVKRLFNASVNAGQLVEVALETKGLHQGVYFVKVTSQSTVLTQKVLLSHNQ